MHTKSTFAEYGPERLGKRPAKFIRNGMLHLPQLVFIISLFFFTHLGQFTHTTQIEFKQIRLINIFPPDFKSLLKSCVPRLDTAYEMDNSSISTNLPPRALARLPIPPTIQILDMTSTDNIQSILIGPLRKRIYDNLKKALSHIGLS